MECVAHWVVFRSPEDTQNKRSWNTVSCIFFCFLAMQLTLSFFPKTPLMLWWPPLSQCQKNRATSWYTKNSKTVSKYKVVSFNKPNTLVFYYANGKTYKHSFSQIFCSYSYLSITLTFLSFSLFTPPPLTVLHVSHVGLSLFSKPSQMTALQVWATGQTIYSFSV